VRDEPKAPPPSDRLRSVSLAAPPSLVARLERLRAVLIKREPGLRPSRSSAARCALEAGLSKLLGEEEPVAR
jgi:hypothetical protein